MDTTVTLQILKSICCYVLRDMVKMPHSRWGKDFAYLTLLSGMLLVQRVALCATDLKPWLSAHIYFGSPFTADQELCISLSSSLDFLWARPRSSSISSCMFSI